LAAGRNNQRTKKFGKMRASLPKNVQGLVDDALELYLQDPSHGALHAHELKDSKRGRHKQGSISIWVSYRYRAVCVSTATQNLWYWVGSHESYNSFVGSRKK